MVFMRHDGKPVTYIGDAVYAAFDGYGIELRLNSHESECVVYLEPPVLQSLIHFFDAVMAEAEG